MSEPPPASDDVGLAASLTHLLTALVRIPSRADGDRCDALFACVRAWLAERGVSSDIIADRNGALALLAPVPDSTVPPVLLLNAPADTAGFGDVAQWRHAPVSGDVAAGFLYGRGAADSKAGIAVFCHLLAHRAARGGLSGLGCVFDADEHSGGFAGIQAALARYPGPPGGVLIGYPGLDRIMTGARGIWRATVMVHGIAAHSGASRERGRNAVAQAAAMATALQTLGSTWHARVSAEFPLAPKLTVTGIRGGGEFSLVPDRCEIDIDVRLTPLLPAAEAEACVRARLADIDAELSVRVAWPPYHLPEASPLIGALAGAAQRVLGVRPLTAIAGPANIGNLLAGRGIPAICGFGVAYRNAHAADECVELASLVPVFHSYAQAVERLLT